MTFCGQCVISWVYGKCEAVDLRVAVRQVLLELLRGSDAHGLETRLDLEAAVSAGFGDQSTLRCSSNYPEHAHIHWHSQECPAKIA